MIKEIKKMKSIVTIALTLALAFPAFAEDETLLSGEFTSGGYGGLEVKFTNIDNDFAVLAGARGGWIINHRLILGAGGYGLVQDNINRYPIGFERYNFLTMGYGGFMMELDFNPHKLVHGSGLILIGGGELSRAISAPYYWEPLGNTEDGFFVVEPEVNVTVNMTSFMRISTGASYRFVSDVEMNGLTNEDISGPAASLTLRFGKF
jgi:hypothetical protein